MILFPLPDLDAPGGGVRIIYGMAQALRSAGIDAAVWHGDPAFRQRWFEHDVPIVSGLERRLDAGDVLVMPELGGARFQYLTDGARVVILNQRHFYTFFGFDWQDPAPDPYPGWPNAVAAVATSQAIEDFLRAVCGDRVAIHQVPVFVDEAMFLDEPKTRQIVLPLNRREDDLAAIATLIRRSPRLPEGWRIVGIESMTNEQVARLLSQSAVFVSLSERDGFSLPGAEAMAAGCRVVGFHGDGAREYLRPEFSVVVDDPDLVALADAVVDAAVLFEQDRARFDAERASAREHVREHYARSVFERRTVEVFSALLDSGAGQEAPCVVRHHEYHWRRVSLARRAARRARRVLRGS